VPFVSDYGTRTRKLRIHPPPVGKLQHIAKHCMDINLDEVAFAASPINECMRLCSESMDSIITLMAIATMENPRHVLDDDKVQKRADFFRFNSSIYEFVNVVMTIFTLNDFRDFIGSIRWIVMLRLNDPTSPREQNGETGLIEKSEGGLLGDDYQAL
jgi:hypothetical protein